MDFIQIQANDLALKFVDRAVLFMFAFAAGHGGHRLLERSAIGHRLIAIRGTRMTPRRSGSICCDTSCSTFAERPFLGRHCGTLYAARTFIDPNTL